MIIIVIAIVIVFVSHSLAPKSAPRKARDDGAQRLLFIYFYSICRMSAVVIVIVVSVVVVVTTQNNVNRIYFSWKYRLKSLYTGNLLSEAKWAFFCRFHAFHPLFEKFDSQILSLNLLGCWSWLMCVHNSMDWVNKKVISLWMKWKYSILALELPLPRHHLAHKHTHTRRKSTIHWIPLSKKLRPSKTK